MMFGIELKWIESLCPLAFSNCGPSCLKRPASEPPAMSLSSEAFFTGVIVVITSPSTIAIPFIRLP